MTTRPYTAGGTGRGALLGAFALASMASGALAQPVPPPAAATTPAGPGSGPPPAGPRGAGPPGAGPGGPAGLPGLAQGWPLSPSQKLVMDLPPPPPGGHMLQPPLTAESPMPSADPRDLSGAWYHDQDLEFRMQRNMYGEPAPYNAAGAAVIARRVKANAGGTPFVNASARCRPPGPTWQRDLNFPFQIFQSKDALEFVFREYHGRWNVVFDPKLLPEQKSYMGRSIAHWDGNTLVVESSDFKQDLWLDVDGTPLSASGKLVQRIRKVDNGERQPYLEVITTIIDPRYYTKPWPVVRTFAWTPAAALFEEYNCEEQIGDPFTDADAGMIAEPKD